MLTYGAARDAVWRVASGLLRASLSVERPLAILSENSIAHGVLSLAAMHVGIPVLPISPAYSLQSKDFAKLRAVFELMTPGAVFVSDGARYGPALRALQRDWSGPVFCPAEAWDGSDIPWTAYEDLLEVHDEPAVAAAFAAIGPDTIAKFLLTSGSTGAPKAVINTQRMLKASQQAKTQVWPFLANHAPILVDWLPWNHTFGGNHNFNMVLCHGGTLYIDAGRPMPGLFQETVRNLGEIAPTVYLNVPRGFDMLVEALKESEPLRRHFFSRLQVIFYAAAALPQHLWDALSELSMHTLGESVVMVSSWGSTETAPLAADCHFQASRAGVIGLPVPGVELKLVKSGAKEEIRVRGPNVTPGYWRRPELTAKAFDEEGYYCIGDAVCLVDPDHPEKGLVFDGRVAEDFKLSSGTWVNVGQLRVAVLAALGVVAQDVVITGHNRDVVGLLVFPNLLACRKLARSNGLSEDAPVVDVLADGAVRRAFHAGLCRLRDQGGGSAMRAERALLLAEGPQIDAGEITDKGYINQAAVLERRRDAVEALYAVPQAAALISL
jgi:feruloyl-CoA synthase